MIWDRDSWLDFNWFTYSMEKKIKEADYVCGECWNKYWDTWEWTVCTMHWWECDICWKEWSITSIRNYWYLRKTLEA